MVFRDGATIWQLSLYLQHKEDDWLCILQKKDPKIKGIIDVVNKNEKEIPDEKRLEREYEVRGGRLEQAEG
ncbi:hypothetical protein Trydic_g23498 [Trypoxylus dichotomus]